MLELAVLVQIILLILAGLTAAKIGKYLRVPTPIPLLITGYLIGPDVLNLLKPAQLGIDLSFIAAAAIPFILFYDGLKTSPSNLRESWKSVASMITIAVFVTVSGIGLCLHFLFGFDWVTAFLVGAILSSTDPAAIIPVLQKLNISKRLSSVLEAETAFNDATAISIFLVLLGFATGAAVSLESALAKFLFLLVASTVVGFAVGVLFTEVLKQLKIEHDLMFISIVILLAAYGLAEYFGASGVIACVVAAIVFGSYLRSPKVESFPRLYAFNGWDELNFLAIAAIFLLLGSSISFSTISPYLSIGLLIALAFVYLVRPATVILSLALERNFNLREKLFISWVGSPRGTVSAALASLLVSKATAGFFPVGQANAIFGITIIVIITTIVITSLSASRVSKALLHFTENSEDEEYRALTAELKAMQIAKRRLDEEAREGLVPQKIYRELSERHEYLIKEIEKVMTDLAKKNPSLEERNRVFFAKKMLTTEMSVIREAFDNKEISENIYNELMGKYNSLMTNLNVVEEQSRELMASKEEKRSTKK
ncbi:MAG: cation:proton antiporter [Candidatus Norongarragalinales archaeon]